MVKVETSRKSKYSTVIFGSILYFNNFESWTRDEATTIEKENGSATHLRTVLAFVVEEVLLSANKSKKLPKLHV